MKVFLLSRRGLAIRKVRADFMNRRAMDPAPYGFDAAEHEPGVEISYSDGSPDPNWLSNLTWARLGFDLAHTLRNLPAMRRADVIWTVLEWEWAGASFLQRVGLLQPKPIIGNSVFLPQTYRSEGRARRFLWPRLMTRNVFLTLHARRAMDAVREIMPGKRFHLVPFGISTRAFPVTPPRAAAGRGDRPIRVYSIGDDAWRDWECMLRAFGNDPRFEVRIACRWFDPGLAARYDNLQIMRDADVDEQRASFEWADAVVMPMRDNVYSGITVACEAVAMGRPVVCSRTGGVPTYFDEGELFYVPVGDAGAMREAILGASPEELEARAAAAQARFLRDDYSAAGMVRRYLDLSRALLGGRTDRQGRRRARPRAGPEASAGGSRGERPGLS